MYPNVNEFVFEPTAARFGIKPIDPGWIYIVQNNRKYKIGKTRNPTKRFKEARTWIPEIRIVAVKPFLGITYVERVLHIVLVWHWHSNEWHKFIDREHKEIFMEEFFAFDDSDINGNSVDFPYFINGTGLGDFGMEFSSKNTSLKKWREIETQKDASISLLK